MSRRHRHPAGWGPPWKREGWNEEDWKRYAASWEMRPGAQAWRGFGRKLLFGLVFMFLFFGMAMWLLFKIIGSLFTNPFGFLLAPAIIVVLVAVSARSWRPVRGLIDAAGRLADGDYTVRVAPSGPSSSRQVAESFNEMARRLETADEQRRRLLADLGHELRTPLTVVRGEIEAIADGVHEPDPEHLQQLLDEVAVMERLLEDLRTLSMAEAGALALHLEPTDLASLVSDTVDGHRRMADSQAVAVSLETDEVGEVLVDPVRIREIVSNLAINALRAMPTGGALRVTVSRDGSEAVIRVRDTGTGIAEEDLDRVFERFTKGSTSSGSGLGLTISRDLVEAHGGSISIDSDLAVGTTVEVRLPRRITQ